MACEVFFSTLSHTPGAGAATQQRPLFVKLFVKQSSQRRSLWRGKDGTPHLYLRQQSTPCLVAAAWGRAGGHGHHLSAPPPSRSYLCGLDVGAIRCDLHVRVTAAHHVCNRELLGLVHGDLRLTRKPSRGGWANRRAWMSPTRSMATGTQGLCSSSHAAPSLSNGAGLLLNPYEHPHLQGAPC